MVLRKVNLHVHSNFSDGLNSIEQIANKAIKLGLEYICITDHLSNSWKSNIIPTLDNSTKISDYLRKISNINSQLEHNDINLRILKGVEIDIGSDMNYIIRLINPKKFDLILFEYLESYDGIAFISNLINYWRIHSNRKFELAIFGLAHLDPSYFYYSNFHQIVDLFTENDLIYEFNTSYPHSYSSKYQSLFQ
ncbi:MAG: PHP domain-containing protein, partial [Candidatus Thorarchaeota archaeon]